MTNPSDIQYAYDVGRDALIYRHPSGRSFAFAVAQLREFWPATTSAGLRASLPHFADEQPRIVSAGSMTDFAALRAGLRKNGR